MIGESTSRVLGGSHQISRGAQTSCCVVWWSFETRCAKIRESLAPLIRKVIHISRKPGWRQRRRRRTQRHKGTNGISGHAVMPINLLLGIVGWSLYRRSLRRERRYKIATACQENSSLITRLASKTHFFVLGAQRLPLFGATRMTCGQEPVPHDN